MAAMTNRVSRAQAMSEAVEGKERYIPRDSKRGLVVEENFRFMLIRHKVLLDGRERKDLYFVQCVNGDLGYVPARCLQLSLNRYPVVKKGLLYVAENSFHTSSPPREINVERGEMVRVLDSRPNGWVNGTLANKTRGWFPSNILKEPTIPCFHFSVRARDGYTRCTEEELTIIHGEKLDVIERPTPRDIKWLLRKNTGEVGTVPEKYLQEDLFDTESVLCNLQWYHQLASRVKAENLLRGKPEGTFLVRDSETTRGNFSIDIKAPGDETIHIKVEVSRQGYKTESDDHWTKSLDSLITRYRNKVIYTDERHGYNLMLAYPLLKGKESEDKGCRCIII